MLLDVSDLQIAFPSRSGLIHAVNGISFQLKEGETLALIGESGSGKSVTALALMGLLPKQTQMRGQILFQGHQLMGLKEAQWRSLRGRELSIIFQDPMTSLNPTMRVGQQIAEGLMRHQHLSKREALQQAIALLERVGLPDPEAQARYYPHQLSGGMRQRVMIAMALACRPALIIADEPTTALDPTLRRQVLKLLKELQRETKAAVLLITHDFGVVAGMADQVAVMYAGCIIERACVDMLFRSPQHPYTRGLLQAVPHLDLPSHQLKAIPGSPPSLSQLITGCPFAPRCSQAMRICHQTHPSLTAHSKDHESRCWLHQAAQEGEA